VTSIVQRYGDGSFVRSIAAIISLVNPQRVDSGPASRSSEDSQTLAILETVSALLISSSHSEVVALGATLLPRDIAVELSFESGLPTKIAQGHRDGGQVEQGTASKLDTSHQISRGIEQSLSYSEPGNAA
jgi:hypothetical protein